jgi:hypothetical protein
MALAVMTCIRAGAAAATRAFTLEQQASGQPGKCEQKKNQGNKVNFHKPNLSKYTNLEVSQPL